VTTTQPLRSVLILGAGLTGLVTAYHLSRQGHRVTILDHPGWREGFHANSSDAAPIALGCHHETHNLLRVLETGIPGQIDTALPLEFWLPDGRIVPYRSARLPGALQWMTSLFSFDGLAWPDRWKLFSHLEQIWEDAQALPADLASRVADEWLAAIGQSEAARQQVWHPLAQWLTGNALTHLSAAVFVRLLSTVFLGHAGDARLTHLDGSVGDRFLLRLRASLIPLGTVIQPCADPPALRFEQNRLIGVTHGNHTLHTADWYVAALSPPHLLPLLPERLLTRYAYFAHMADLALVPQLTIQFTARPTTRTPRFILLAGRPFDQVLITASGSQTIRLRFSTGSLCANTGDGELIDLGKRELHRFHSLIETGTELPEIHREDQAALSLKPGTALLRPIQQSPIANFLVAGAWTDTGWPANVESALVSARRCTDAITRAPM
jgi:hypothetical protein